MSLRKPEPCKNQRRGLERRVERRKRTTLRTPKQGRRNAGDGGCVLEGRRGRGFVLLNIAETEDIGG